ncbi:hypothetical protein PPYR_07511 [Photinus pyralis]|uniref:WAPL domain-containing protein n=2 Tax=Photinus pyralis TaxID=7054 RepID=A0A5N4AQN8_PHOPY|nr:uncharacterized protein LOC116169337 [Photinus pyralis]KAB0799631.1 hypothetical protein PPYR_07511 [Photinus pyralis]
MNGILSVVALFTLANGLSDEFRLTFSGKVQEIVLSCLEEMDNQNSGEAETASAMAVKCLQACLLTNLGMMQDGRFSRDGTLVLLDEMRSNDLDLYTKLSAGVDEVNDEMQNIKQNNECEYAQRLAHTIQRVAWEHNIHLEDFM